MPPLQTPSATCCIRRPPCCTSTTASWPSGSAPTPPSRHARLLSPWTTARRPTGHVTTATRSASCGVRRWVGAGPWSVCGWGHLGGACSAGPLGSQLGASSCLRLLAADGCTRTAGILSTARCLGGLQEACRATAGQRAQHVTAAPLPRRRASATATLNTWWETLAARAGAAPPAAPAHPPTSPTPSAVSAPCAATEPCGRVVQRQAASSAPLARSPPARPRGLQASPPVVLAACRPRCDTWLQSWARCRQACSLPACWHNSMPGFLCMCSLHGSLGGPPARLGPDPCMLRPLLQPRMRPTWPRPPPRPSHSCSPRPACPPRPASGPRARACSSCWPRPGRALAGRAARRRAPLRGPPTSRGRC